MLIYLKSLRPKYLIPRLEVNNLNDIEIENLKKEGIKSLIFDVDNTLCGFKETSIDESIKPAFRRLTSEFNSCILSNTSPERRIQLESYFELPAIQTSIKKPNPGAFLEALKYLKTDSLETAMIGDRLLTDIAGANMAGLYTIKVKPIKWSSEPINHSAIRGIETFILRFYQH